MNLSLIHRHKVGPICIGPDVLTTGRWAPTVLVLALLFITGGCCSLYPKLCWNPSRNMEILNSWGERVEEIEIGQTLSVGLTNLKPNQSYRVTLRDREGRLVSFYQLTANNAGSIATVPLWYHSGVVGCSRFEAATRGQYRFRSFDEAYEALANRTLYLTVTNSRGEVLGKQPIPVVSKEAQQRPLIYFSDSKGCLMDGYVIGKDDVYITGRYLPPGAAVQIFLVPNKYGWKTGWKLLDVRRDYRVRPHIVRLERGRTSFTELVWKSKAAKLGAYDVVLRINDELTRPEIRKSDLVMYHLDTGMLMQFAYDPPWAPNDFDIAGRLDKNWGYPYFEFHDVFAKGEEMWGAVDPAMVPAGHPGGNYAAFYVIPQGSAPSGLSDVTEELEIVPVKGTCINVSMTPIWNNPQAVGEYDVVVDFGSTAAGTETEWTSDGTFDVGVDFIDRATTIGAYVVNDPATPGPETVLSWEYQPDPEDTSDPLWTDVSGYFGTPSLGYSADQVPLHAIVRYPQGSGPFPLVLIVHGNHSPFEASEPGYFYLCELLASHGFITVTVDENFLNGTWGEMDARAIVLLRHLQRWRDWNGTPGHTFYNKVDMNNIGLAGHSRGGEAITIAWLFNTSLHNSSDPNHDFNFSIKSHFAFAPTDGRIGYTNEVNPATGTQYAGIPIAVEDDDYLVMHGSHDGDVSSFGGHKTYDRAHPVNSIPTACKCLLWVYGANHSYWNTVWATSGDPSVIEPNSHLISDTAQQAIGKVYMSAYFQMTLQGKDEYRALVAGDLQFDSLPDGVTLVHQYQDKDRVLLNHYEEDDILSTGSYLGVTNGNSGNLIDPYLDRAFSDRWSGYHLWQQTDGLIAGWNSTSAQYEISLPTAISGLVDTYPYLSFRVGQAYESTPSFNTPGVDQDFMVELELGANNSHKLKVSNFDSLPYPEETNRGGSNNTKTIMKTVRIPLRSFVVNRADWDLHDLSKIRFLFNVRAKGLLAIDEIQLTK